MKISLTKATRKFIRDPLKSLNQHLKKDYLSIFNRNTYSYHHSRIRDIVALSELFLDIFQQYVTYKAFL